jgi:hypothetical protein
MKKLIIIFLSLCLGCAKVTRTSNLEWNSAIDGNTLFLAYINDTPMFFDSLKLNYRISYSFREYQGCKWAIIPVRIVDEKATTKALKNNI